jgi:Ca-activated chloride channel family protein
VDRVTFSLDGEPVLTRGRPPYSVELDLGDSPRPRAVRATSYDAAGREIGSDELEVNAGENRFAVRIVEPHSGRAVDGLVTVRAQVLVPDEATLDRLELYRGEDLVAALHQPPFEQPIAAPAGAGYFRAVAWLRDGSVTEDLVLVNVEGALEEMDVDLVELYATVLDGRGRPVTGISQNELRVQEEGSLQTIVRFEPVADRPVHLAIVLDRSASMEDHLPAVRKAAVGFLESFLEPRDRAALVVFDDKPRLLEKLTNDVGALAEEIAGFAAEGNTALYDSVIFALHHLAGVRGKKAVLVITDGKDETSRFDFEQTLDYSRAAGSLIYTIGIGTDLGTRRHLAKLAEESGGRSFQIEGAAGLEEIYATIAQELRAGYLIVYQSSRPRGDRAFRRVEVGVSRPGHEVRTLRGYFP